MTEADRLSDYADVPHELAELVVIHANRADVGIKSLRSPDRRYSMVRIRRGIAIEARAMGYSYTKIGRALNRDHTTVIDLVRKPGWHLEQA
jgi:chromosomal replication initiation ATPase DnaA